MAILGPYTYTPYLWLHLGTVICLVVLCVYAWLHRRVPGALPFAIGSLLGAVWVLASLMEYAAVDVTTKIFWVKVQGVLQLPTVTLIACFVLEYAAPGRWLNRRNLILLAIAPLLFLLLALTNDFHHLAWRGFVYDGAVMTLRGTANWIIVAYAYALGVFEILVFAWLFVRSPQHRWPVAIMVTAQIAVRLVYLLEAVQFFHSDLPIDAIIIAFLFLAYAVALFGFRLFEPIPLASKAVIQQLHSGMLVLDLSGQVVSLNASAQAILGMPGKRALHCPIQDLLPAYAGEATGSTEISLSMGSEKRDYLLDNTALRDWRGMEVGRLLLLRDVTDQKHAQAQIVEQQRALATLHERERLARELHDSTAQMLSYIGLQTQAIRKHLADGNTARADAQLERLAAASSAAHIDIRESILGLKAGSGGSRSFAAALKEYLAAYGDNFGVRTELILASDLEGADFAPDTSAQLLRVIGEALTNARKHSGSKCVQIAIQRGNGRAQIIIADDGRGFDATQLADRENHFGLRFMRERMAQVGGELTIASRPGTGTRVTLEVPVAHEQGETV